MDNNTKILFMGSGGSSGPISFSFTDASNVNPSTLTTSNTITITGLGATATASVTGGEISIASGAWVTSGPIDNGQTIAVRTTSSASFSTAINVTVTIGVSSDIWTVTTRAADLVPNAFSFTTVNNAELNQVNSSTTITVSGLEPNYSPISVTASGDTGFAVAAGTSVIGSYNTSQSVTSSGTGTIVVSARVTSSSSFSSSRAATISIGGVNGTFTVNTRAADETPGAFSFTAQSNVNPSTVCTSNTVTVSGLEPNTSIYVSASNGTVSAGTSAISGTYNSGTFVTTTGSGTLVVAARITSSASFSTGATVTIFVGNGSANFTVTTRAADTSPDAFSFTSQTGVGLSTLITSGLITVTGLEPNFSVTVSCTGGNIDAGTSSAPGVWVTSKSVTTSGTGTLVVRARVTSSSSFNTAVNCNVTVGSGNATFTATTRAPDTIPNPFSFTDQTGVTTGAVITSAQITITGLEPNYSIPITTSGSTGHSASGGTTVISGTYSTSFSVTTSGTGTLVLTARVNSSTGFNTTTNVAVTVGGSSLAIFAVTTEVFSGG